MICLTTVRTNALYYNHNAKSLNENGDVLPNWFRSRPSHIDHVTYMWYQAVDSPRGISCPYTCNKHSPEAFVLTFYPTATMHIT